MLAFFEPLESLDRKTRVKKGIFRLRDALEAVEHEVDRRPSIPEVANEEAYAIDVSQPRRKCTQIMELQKSRQGES